MAEKVYFVRHGESLWNVEDRICGTTDIALTKKGHAQAIATGEEFLRQGIRVDRILHSPLQRAADTARHISEITGVRAQVEPRLMEQNFGKFEGTSPRNAAEFVEAKKCFVYDYEGGESMLHTAHRIYSLLDELSKSDETVLLVAHNGIARMVQSYFTNMTNEEFAAFGVKNCEICCFDFRGV